MKPYMPYMVLKSSSSPKRVIFVRRLMSRWIGTEIFFLVGACRGTPLQEKKMEWIAGSRFRLKICVFRAQYTFA